jgi:gliding motility-associated-like protein
MKIFKWFFLVIMLFLTAQSSGLHLKAGEITADNISGFTWKIRVSIYTYKESIDQHPGLDPETIQLVVFKDLNSRLDYSRLPADTLIRMQKNLLDEDTFENIYEHTYRFSSSGAYKIGVLINFRNEKILNINSGASENIPFYLETYVLVSSLSAAGNSTPDLLVPPIDKAVAGQIYLHNPGATDVNGDSLAFKLVVPKSSAANSDVLNPTGYVSNYEYPDGISIDPVTGMLKWDRPLIPGQYNVAFIVEEYRNNIRIGTILRDMQIDVEESENKPPVLHIPGDTCIIAGIRYDGEISATDPDFNKINLYAYSGLISNRRGNALFTTPVAGPQNTPATGIFSVTPSCNLISKSPYQLIFKAQDVPVNQTPLSDYKVFNFKIVGPPVNLLTADPKANSVILGWEKYSGCSGSKTIHIYRSNCDTSQRPLEFCNPEADLSGFEKIAEVPGDATAYTDDDLGKGLKQGNFYCYRLMVKFESGGTSILSQKLCAEPGRSLPLPVMASVIDTDDSLGKILVQWKKPRDFSEDILGYKISRAVNSAPNDFFVVESAVPATDSVYTDSFLNTNFSYIYRVEVVTTASVYSSNSFSTIDLKLSPGSEKVTLSWQYNVPWNVTEYNHKIFRKTGKDDEFSLLTEISGGAENTVFTDIGLNKEDSVCYFVETGVSYCAFAENGHSFNRSQIVCTIPADSTLPCPPVLSALPLVCEQVEKAANNLSWYPVFDSGCATTIVAYKIYASQREDESTAFLAQSTDTFFVHKDTISLAGCYEVAAVNIYGAESGKSNRVCTDICVEYSLPDFISPNNDGKNDLFIPFENHLNTEKVELEIFNRWGDRIYRYVGNPLILWNGEADTGKRVSDGVYFYSANVKYRRRLRPVDETKLLKGWIQVLDRKSSSE